MNFAILDLSHQFQYEVIQKIMTEKVVNLNYVLTGSELNRHGDTEIIESIASEIFSKNTLIESIERFLFPTNLNSLIIDPWVIDANFIEKCKHIESLSLRVSDRNCAFPIPVQDRRQYYLLVLNHFFKILTERQISHLLVFDTPHSFYSVVFYELAIMLGVKIIRMEYHFLPNHSLLVDHQPFPNLPENFNENLSPSQIWDLLPESVRVAYDSKNSYVNVHIKKEKLAIIGKGAFSGLKLALRFIQRVVLNLALGFFPSLYKKEVLHFTSLNHIRSRLRYRVLINIPLFNLLRKNNYYNKVCTVPDLDQKFIYFGMHMQPEKSSQPMGKDFDNQLIPIKILSESVPNDWSIYVKEHPNQFNVRKIVNNNYRSKQFYDALQKLSNVVLVPIEFSSQDLIENAQMVSTLTGTLGWEALQKGKTVLNFGEPYYRACRGTRVVDSVETCRSAIAELRLLSAEDINKSIYNYLLYYASEGLLVQSSNWETKFAHSSISRKQQIDNISTRIIEIIDTHQLID